MRILFFLEDRAQEGFIKALVQKIAEEEGFTLDELTFDVRSARHGSWAIKEFKRFIKDTLGQRPPEDVDLIVVAIDGNCKGCEVRIKQLELYVKDHHPFKGKVVYAVPDPHIEKWYLMDQRAFQTGVGLRRGPDLPPYKCKKGYYKSKLIQALSSEDIKSSFGGAEYGEKIVQSMDNLGPLYSQDAGLKRFADDLKTNFRSWKQK